MNNFFRLPCQPCLMGERSFLIDMMISMVAATPLVTFLAITLVTHLEALLQPLQKPLRPLDLPLPMNVVNLFRAGL